MVAPLKGFYYDEEKKKYYKIIPHHQAPKCVKYSIEAVKKKTTGQAQASRLSSRIDYP